MKNAATPAMDAEFDLDNGHLGPIETFSKGLDNAANTARSAMAAAAIGAGVAGRKLVKPLAFAGAIASPIAISLIAAQELPAQSPDLHRFERWMRNIVQMKNDPVSAYTSDVRRDARQSAERSEAFHNLPMHLRPAYIDNIIRRYVLADFQRVVELFRTRDGVYFVNFQASVNVDRGRIFAEVTFDDIIPAPHTQEAQQPR